MARWINSIIISYLMLGLSGCGEDHDHHAHGDHAEPVQLLESPDGTLKARIDARPGESLVYSVVFQSDTIVHESQLGF